MKHLDEIMTLKEYIEDSGKGMSQLCGDYAAFHHSMMGDSIIDSLLDEIHKMNVYTATLLYMILDNEESE